ncbi:MAG: hypothetical protein ABL914_13355 [Novosphingobium sp.]|uniref:hypothetical protein n=1 Tax=Novosphingobium sp. TaxID=1874826 RepID=UPI0032BE7F31
MAEPKPIASLSPRLLARKGGARPAMRSQASALQVQHDDLGWNDMGHDADHTGGHTGGHTGDLGANHTADVVPIGPEANFAAHVPEVLRQQRAAVSRIEVERRSALASGRRAAFTLRVDAERHLKLRLACTIQGRSAQQLVTDALDALLNDLPEIADLAAQVAKKCH